MPTVSSDTLRERLDFRVSTETAEQLRGLARDEETTLGTILRRAVRFLLAEEERRDEEPAP